MQTLNSVSTIAQGAIALIALSGMVFGAIKAWPHFKTKNDLIRERDSARRECARAIVERETARAERDAAEARAETALHMLTVMKMGNDGWATTIESLAGQVRDLSDKLDSTNHKLVVAVRYIREIVQHVHDRGDPDTLPPPPKELQDDIES